MGMSLGGTVDKLTKIVAQKALKQAKNVYTLIDELRDEIESLGKDLDAAQLVISELQNSIAIINQAITEHHNDYLQHKHNYIDTTINDTIDGTGTATQTTRTTTTAL